VSIFILPGMAADASMYDDSYKIQNTIRYINWPKYTNERTISEISRRIIREHDICENDIVGGSSLGGMVAAEMCRHVRVRKLILIGSTLTPGNINPVLKKISTLSGKVPVSLLQSLAGKISSIAESRVLKMFSDADTSFIQSMCRAIFAWEGNERPDCSVAHIHGEQDKIIFPPPVGADIIPGAGHLIAMTHASSVVRFLKDHTAY